MSSINPVKQMRSHAGNADFDSVSSRKNFKLTRQKVNGILFSNAKVNGAQFVSRTSNSVTKVYSKREAILGAILTPRLR